MISTHYLSWLYEWEIGSKGGGGGGGDDKDDGDNDLRCCIRDDKLDLLKEAIASRTIPDDMVEWWTKLKFWIWYCYDGKYDIPLRQDEYLVHAAVSNSDTPPIVVELLVSMFPDSVSLSVPNHDDTYPLHIAAATKSYQPQWYELSPKDPGYTGRTVFDLLVEQYSDAANVSSSMLPGRPIDIARLSGKSEEDIEILGQFE
jgi:hypothetical protein